MLLTFKTRHWSQNITIERILGNAKCSQFDSDIVRSKIAGDHLILSGIQLKAPACGGMHKKCLIVTVLEEINDYFEENYLNNIQKKILLYCL